MPQPRTFRRSRSSSSHHSQYIYTPLMPQSKATEEGLAHAQDIIAEKPQRKWTSYFWDTLDKSPEERRFLFKLDAAILSFASLGYFIKYLDQVNVNNAFVSGMEEDLGLYGNQLNYITTCWTVGYVIGQVPSNLLLTRIRPRYWIPAMELIWGVLTFCLSRAESATAIYVIRFFVGLAESSFYPGMQYLIGSWYRKDELAKSSAIGSMFSGYLMAAVFHLNGKGGLRGWQWLFLVDGIITVPIAILGFFVLPDVPEIAKPWYLTKEEVAFAQKRMQLEGRANRGPYTKAKIQKIFKSWHIYVLTLVYVTFNNGGSVGAQPVFAQWLKSRGFSVPEINAYPTTTYAVQVITTLIYAWSSDTIFNGERWPPILFGACMNIITGASLLYWDIPLGWKWASFILAGCGSGLSGLIMAWGHEICTNDNEERALVIGSMNEMAYVFQAWLPNVIWQQVDSPRYYKGFIGVNVISTLLIFSTLLCKFLHKRELLRDERDRQTVFAALGDDGSEELEDRTEVHEEDDKKV